MIKLTRMDELTEAKGILEEECEKGIREYKLCEEKIEAIRRCLDVRKGQIDQINSKIECISNMDEAQIEADNVEFLKEKLEIALEQLWPEFCALSDVADRIFGDDANIDHIESMMIYLFRFYSSKQAEKGGAYREFVDVLKIREALGEKGVIIDIEICEDKFRTSYELED
jgi:hypothetical protein